MANNPLLIFPAPSSTSREMRQPAPPRLAKPSSNAQAQRIGPELQRLQANLTSKALSLQGNTHGLQPETVLVIETVGRIQNFINAVKKIEGLEWLGEHESLGIEPEHGFENLDDRTELLRGQLFLVMSDQKGMLEIQRLFQLWRKDRNAEFPYGLAPLKNAFEHIYTIRPWNEQDRIKDTGVQQDWEERIAAGASQVPFEVELWFRADVGTRQRLEANLRDVIRQLGGRVLAQSTIPNIDYHALLGEIPIHAARAISELSDVKFLRCDDVMFIRPVAQSFFSIPAAQEPQPVTAESQRPPGPPPQGEPIAALLDGVPLIRHQYLNGRILFDDPEGYDSGYQASERAHGTGMASLICHGDLSLPGNAATRPLYLRPILQPQRGFRGLSEEIPPNVLATDLIHRAVRRIFSETEGVPAVAPSVRIINLSVCDIYRPFLSEMSPWARLLDQLAVEFNVLFIVSAGNHSHDLHLTVARQQFGTSNATQKQNLIIECLAANNRHRRLLSPAETVNGLTVGATQQDGSNAAPRGNQQDPFVQPDLPAIYGAQGSGYRRMIKPDFLLPGGRQFVVERPGTHALAELTLPNVSLPGQKVASPGQQGNLTAVAYTRGTSNAAALATRAGARIYEVLENIRQESPDAPTTDFDAILMKALLVHGASQGPAAAFLRPLLTPAARNAHQVKNDLARLLGYGQSDISRVIACTEQRVTVLGVGQLEAERAHIYRLPLPPSLSATTTKRRLTITLAWFTPISPRRQSYRKAHLWFDPANILAPTRVEMDHHAVQRGTVQHEILEGDRATAFQDGADIAIKVNCRSDADKLTEPVRYSIAVTLEVAEATRLPIYQEVQARLRTRIPIPPR